MASFHPDLEMVTVRGVTLLIDPSSLVDRCTYLLVGRDTMEPVDSVPTPSAALLLNLGRGDTSQEQRRNSLQMGGLLLNTIGQSQFVRNVPPMSAFLSSLARPPVSSPLYIYIFLTMFSVNHTRAHSASSGTADLFVNFECANIYSCYPRQPLA